MSDPVTEDLIDWRQVGDLLGEDEGAEEREMVASMWRDATPDMAREEAGLDAETDNEGAKARLHRLRGLVAMWGMRAMARAMLACEMAAEPAAEWRSRGAEISELRRRSVAAIEVKYPWLGGGS